MSHTRAKVTNASRLIPRDCPYCKRFMGPEFLVERLKQVQKQKGERIRESRMLAKQYGEPWGRERTVDYELIYKLRESGLSLSEIAEQLQTTRNKVVYALRIKRGK